MKPSVTQRHEMSCGLACVSFVTGKPYELLTTHEIMENLTKRGFTCIGLVQRLRKEGYRYSWRKITDTKPMEDFPVGAILFVGRSNTLPYGHWLVLSDHGWMDSWINWQEDNNIKHAQSDFRRHLPGKPKYVLLPQS